MRDSFGGLTQRFWLGVFVVGVTLAAIPAAVGQLPTATISGVVKDSSGAVIPEVTVTATNTETGMTRSSQTGNNGSFRFPALAVGTYDVRAEHPGFQVKLQQGLRITVGQEAVLNFILEVGAVTETVSVTAEAPIVNTTSGTLGSLVSERTVADLPLNGRNFTDLTLLQTGVAESRNVGTVTGALNGTQFSANGAPIRSNTFMIDGTIMNDVTSSGPASTNETALGIEGIREFRVVTNSFSAEYGMNMGSQITLVTKNGTNELHGSLFEYLRNSVLDARNWTDIPDKPAFRRNNFGGSLGGPIRRDQLFYFLTYEGLRQGRGVSLVNTVPSAAARQDGGLVPKIADSVKPYLALYPLPNGPDLGQGLARYYRAETDVQRENFGQARVDHTLSGLDSFFGRYTIDDAFDFRPYDLPPLADNFWSRNQWITLSENHIFTPTLLNAFRTSFSRTHQLQWPTAFAIPNLSFAQGRGLVGGLGITGVTDIGAGKTQDLNQRVFSFSDDLFYTRGEHGLKFGTLINFYRQFINTSTRIDGAWSFANLAAFLTATPRSFQVATPGSIFHRTFDYVTLGFYVQDDWRITPTLTLNLGLRYEFTTQVEEIRGNGAALRDMQHDAAVTPGPPFENNSLRNIGPRFGFAWDVMGDGKTALRGGFGLLYDLSTYGSAFMIVATGTPPQSSQTTLSGPTLPAFGPYPSIPSGAAGRALRTIDYHVQQPHLLSYNLTVERQLPLDMGLTLSYAGSRGINLLQIKEGNPTVPQGWVEGRTCVSKSEAAPFVTDGPKCWTGNDPRTNPNWDDIDLRTAGGNSWYNSLQVGLLKRLSRGLQFQSSYTWSHALDETQGQLGGPEGQNGGGVTGDDPSNRRHDKGSAMFDFRHQWRINAIYRFPSALTGGWGRLGNGWWISSILTWDSGFPFDPVLGQQRSRSRTMGPTGGLKRPDLVPGVKHEDITRGTSRGCQGVAAGTPLGTPNLFLDPCAFAISPLGFLGTAGRSIIYGPNFSNLNFSLVKDTPLPLLGESGSLQFRVEIFNLLNHPSLGIPSRTVYAARTDSEPPLAGIGQITSTLSKSRDIQFALKILF